MTAWPHIQGAGARCILEAAAQDAARVIESGDVAECAAYVPGETGRDEAMHNRDSLYEDPAAWLRAYAARFEADEFGKWHEENPGECPLCNPHVCDDYCHNCEGAL